jgi:hypothetical protein
MATNPFYNALFAMAYIVTLVSVVFQGPRLLDLPQQSVFYPILALSVLVLSVSLMAYLFFYQPLILVLDGKRDVGRTLFLQTLGIFALTITLMVILSILLLSLGIL